MRDESTGGGASGRSWFRYSHPDLVAIDNGCGLPHELLVEALESIGVRQIDGAES